MTINRPVSAVIFDWDGTLQDSMPEQYKGFQAVFAAEGLKAPSLEFFCQNLTMPIGPWYKYLGIQHQTEEDIIQTFRKTTNKLGCPLFPGVKECLDALAANNIKAGVVSAGRTNLIRQVIHQNGLEDKLDFLVGESWDKVPALKNVCEELKLSPANCIYVGDLVSDIRDGKSAGLMTLAFISQYSSEQAFNYNQPDAFAHSFAELQKKILSP